MIARLAGAIDRRIGGAAFARGKTSKVFPESWTFLFGEVALYCFVILVVTGTFLALFFDASMAETTYTGSYGPMAGTRMTVAYRSALDLSFDVQGGLLIRQIHHWAALAFLAAIVVHLLRVFFTGAFRKPRELNWVIGVTLLLLGIVEGFAGYSLLDDVLSGVGVRIMHATLESLPLIGPRIASAVFGGPYPGEDIIPRLFVAHVFLVPALIGGLVAGHLALVFRQIHTQFPGKGRTQHNVVGLRMWPGYATRSVGLLLLVAAVLVGLGAYVQINPVWFWGPYHPWLVTTAAQPDWYMGWLEGALRLFPPVEITVAGRMIPQPFFPAIALPGVVFGLLYAYPWIERRVTGDRRAHELLDRPRDRPGRMAFGIAVLVFFVLLMAAGGQDIFAVILGVPLRAVTWTLRVSLLVLPPVAGLLAWRWARDLSRGRRPVGEDAFAELEEPSDDDGEGGNGGPGGSGGTGGRPRAAGVAVATAVGGLVGALAGSRLLRRDRR